MNTQPPIFPGNQTFANEVWPGAPDPQRPREFHVAVADHTATDPQAIASKDVRFNAIQFVPMKANGSANAGNVYLYIRNMDANDGTFALVETIATGGAPLDWNPPDKEQYCGADFAIKTDNDADGVQIIYS